MATGARFGLVPSLVVLTAWAMGQAHAAAPAPGEVLVDGIPRLLLASVYFHVADNDSEKVQVGAETVLVFDRNDVAYLVEPDRSRPWAREGTYSFRNGRLNLRFNTRGFVRQASIPYVLGAKELLLPFKVLSDGKGTSRWERPKDWDVDSTILAIYNAVQTTRGLDSSKAVAIALRYAQSFVVSKPSSPVEYVWASPSGPRLLAVEKLGSSIKVTFEDGVDFYILLERP